MTQVNEALHWIFVHVFYPCLVGGVLLYIIAFLSLMITRTRGTARARRFVAALIPFAALVFAVVYQDVETVGIAGFLGKMNGFFRFLTGGTLGLIILELGRHLMKTDNEVGPALYSLFLSTLGAFILYLIMTNSLRTIHEVFLGLILIGGLHMVLRGVTSPDAPRDESRRRPSSR